MEQNIPLKADGFDEAVIGLAEVWEDSGRRKVVIVYSHNRCVEILMERDGMSEEDAMAFMEYNVVNAYMGRNTPIFVRDYYDLESIEEIHGADAIKEVKDEEKS